MQIHHSRRVVLGLLVVVLLVTGVASAVPTGQTLVVERVDTGEVVVSQPVEQGDRVALVYTHSVEKTRVYDGYTVRDGYLELTRMEFESYGWGLPTDANVTREDGVFVYDPPGTAEDLYVKPGRIAGHRLLVDDREYDLVGRADAESVRVHLRDRSALDALSTYLTTL
ncbi:DUF1850 domain-containing protein [Salinirubrum litoreum]|uniref:DUF1850 domain-containing protein n=1 Tax=Salinirubrum litoreum TaxID=1126234 RepID=A0ABD5RG85_9EURY|nr:DUF1850 domain-containing protein [Salinirubrum litoreum]